MLKRLGKVEECVTECLTNTKAPNLARDSGAL